MAPFSSKKYEASYERTGIRLTDELTRNYPPEVERQLTDLADRYLFPSLYLLGKDRLDALQAFAREPNVYYFDRQMACAITSQVARHEPERRPEVVRWFEELFTFLLAPEDDLTRIDTNFIGLSVHYVLDFRGRELLPLINRLWDRHWIPPTVMGDLTEITSVLHLEPNPADLHPFPQNLEEYYSQVYLERQARSNEPVLYSRCINTPAWNMVEEKYQTFSDPDTPLRNDGCPDEAPAQPVARIAPKIDRNDPCPCGSGK